VRPEELCQWNIPMISPGIQPATSRLVAQCLNQLRSTACPAVPYFPTFSHKQHECLKWKDLLNTKCGFWFPHNFCPKHFSSWEVLGEIRWKTVMVFHAKYPLFLSDFNITQIFATDILKWRKYQNFNKIRPVAAELFLAGRRAEGDTWRS